MATATGRWLFTVDDFAKMGEAGIFDEDDRVELIDGEVIPMSPIGHQHVCIVNRLNFMLCTELASRAVVSVQNPATLDDYTQPQPDVVVFRYDKDYYADALPTAVDVLVVIEISDSSLDYDLNVKTPRYAKSGIPETWLVDVNASVVTQFSEPSESGYRRQVQLRAGDELVCGSIESLRIAVKDIFGAK